MKGTGNSRTGEQPPEVQFMNLLSGKWVVQAIATAAELRLADHLDSPLAAAELAERVGCVPEPLLRVLRVLVGEGLLEQGGDGRYSLTELGEQLKSGKLRDLAEFVGSESQWTPWLHLTEAVRGGTCAFEATYGETLFEYLGRRPEPAQLYDSAVEEFTRAQAQRLAELPLMGEVESLVDVGGGRGTLLRELLVRHPHLKGVLVDRGQAVEGARQCLASAGVLERSELVDGDFFESLPEGADCYVIKHVLHNWSDARAQDLLEACARVMAPAGRIVVVEGLLLPGNRRDLTRLMDLEMLVLTGEGRERSKPEFRALLHRAGLRLAATHPLTPGAWALVAERAS